ncbi:hypothetical protein AMECASPLE_039750 [Ameca splendens]|uniref:Uncharacterized protein n=1 Tax=Ameca splendens TaxID=208324 RepID=A0ABV0YWB6_9TELE
MQHRLDLDRGGYSSQSRLSRCHCRYPHGTWKSPSKITESLGGALCSTPSRDAKKAGYSTWPVGRSDSQRPVSDLNVFSATQKRLFTNINSSYILKRESFKLEIISQ